MRAALVTVTGYVPVPLTGHDHLELLPVRRQTITASGIRIHHRTYDAELLAPYRGQPSPIAGRGGRWEIHHNPHDVRQIWVRLPDGELTEIPWIHRDHIHEPFNDHTWQHIRTLALHDNHGDTEQYEADPDDALDQLMRRVHSGHATKTEQALITRTTAPLPHSPPPRTRHPPARRQPRRVGRGPQHQQPRPPPRDDTLAAATRFGLYDAHEEPDKW